MPCGEFGCCGNVLDRQSRKALTLRLIENRGWQRPGRPFDLVRLVSCPRDDKKFSAWCQGGFQGREGLWNEL